MKKESFIFFQDWGNYILALGDANALDLTRAIISYGIGKEYEIKSDDVRAYFEGVVLPDMIANEEKKNRYRERQAEKGRAGGLAKANKAKQSVATASHGQPQLATASHGWQSLAKPSKSSHIYGDGNGIDISNDISISGMFKSSEMDQVMTEYITMRSAKGYYPPSSISQTLSLAKQNEEKFGSDECIECVRKAISGCYSAIVWPKATKAKTGFNQMSNNQYDFDQLEEKLLKAQEV